MDDEMVSGGGVSFDVVVGLDVPADAAAQLDGSRDEMYVLVTRLGHVRDEYLPAVAAAVDAAAAVIPGALHCQLTAAPLFDDDAAGAVELELLATVNAARDALLESLLPFAPEIDRFAPWRPILQMHGPNAVPATSWLTSELRLIAVLRGPLGSHTRILSASQLGERVTITG